MRQLSYQRSDREAFLSRWRLPNYVFPGLVVLSQGQGCQTSSGCLRIMLLSVSFECGSEVLHEALFEKEFSPTQVTLVTIIDNDTKIENRL